MWNSVGGSLATRHKTFKGKSHQPYKSALRNSNLIEKMPEWEKKYGPIVTVHLGPLRAIVLNTYAVIQEAFVQKSTDFAGRPKIYSLLRRFSSSWQLSRSRKAARIIAATDYGPTWQLHRRLALRALGYLKDDKEFQRICSLFNKQNKEFGNGFFEDIFPPLRLCPTAKFRRTMALFNEILKFVYTKIDHHKKTFSPDNQRDLTDAILIAQKELAAEESPDRLAEITETHFAQTIVDIFSGARITPLLSDRAKLPYTEAVLYESMRIATVAPFGVPHSTTCDTSLGGYTFPKGTFIMSNLYAVHHDPQLWKDPWKFKPERFLDSKGKFTRPEGWMPFSVGKRACMAESLAKPELHMILAALYRNFEIRMPDGVTADLEPAKAGLVYLPKSYKVDIKDRFA